MLSRNEFRDADQDRQILPEWFHGFYDATRRDTSGGIKSPNTLGGASFQARGKDGRVRPRDRGRAL